MQIILISKKKKTFYTGELFLFFFFFFWDETRFHWRKKINMLCHNSWWTTKMTNKRPRSGKAPKQLDRQTDYIFRVIIVCVATSFKRISASPLSPLKTWTKTTVKLGSTSLNSSTSPWLKQVVGCIQRCMYNGGCIGIKMLEIKERKLYHIRS